MARVEHVIYKRVLELDRRSIERRSQKAGTGGGARDIRLNPARLFGKAVPKILTETRTTAQGRTVYSAPVHWVLKGKIQPPVEMEIWSPTKARKEEMRLARAHELPPFDEQRLPLAGLDPFFFIWKDEERVWARYVTIDQLRMPGWPKSLVDPILRSLKTVPQDRSIRGWRNLMTEEGEHRDSR